ncbi:MAG: asparagine synthase (glutamine-hydrolyzing) [Acidobacteria bacterium]|nr:asparagine synthase (glutamine-hydrolyzing) [Acidobacteriota bacterium]
MSVGFEPSPKYIRAASHRGPDGEGSRVFASPSGPVAMGHQRLSILDPASRSAQPISDNSERYSMVFNGEIYNYIELRRELQASGVCFRTESDTEVLLQAIIHWGPQALGRLIGMFSFVIWDDHDKILLIARDRVGIKPLVLHSSSEGIAFASEIKQLLLLPTFRRRMNLARAYDFLSSGVTDHLPGTMFDDASNLSPGRFLRLDLKTWRPGHALPAETYWTPPSPDMAPISEGDAADKFRELFFDSIRLQMRADVKVGACLSGGLDSSAIVCAQSKARPRCAEPFGAVSAVFPGTSVDESAFIRDVVAASKVRSILTTVRPQTLIEDTEIVLRAQDEPYGSTSIVAQYNVFRAARENGIKVMLDGQGADELLGGYHGCFPYHYRGLVRQMKFLSLVRAMQERKAWHGICVPRSV